ncbi:MAG: UDP-N-acetylmuramoyl-L-alanyl-D-glutamate--2,6-diaminopimelate ligase [Coriobacteriia bacterium]|nr:UDP-N-acetylmuramoyl-L-alanyl-D-glutamate--2,6-diaminopimelate ligase [Coriobacteriia bacterium]
MSLLEGTGAIALGAADVAVSGVAYRSDRVSSGDLFVCVRGFSHDGHHFAADAVSRGAVALVVERELTGIGVPQFVVVDSREALARIAARFEGDPSASMAVIGITGTNGKTTTTYLVDAIMREAGHTTGVIGTVETRIGDRTLDASHTTPESRDLQHLLAEMRDEGVSAVAMEVSSHAIDLHRIDAVRFAVAAFTNLTQDHLDYHQTIEAYASVKRRLFTDFEVCTAVINIDDEYCRGLAAQLPEAVTVGRDSAALVRAEDERLFAGGAAFELVTPHGRAHIELPLAGAYNVSNALVAAACALSAGVDFQTVVRGLEAAPQVPGRLERVDCGQPFSVVVDYAHTPDSLEKALAAVRQVTEGKVIAVFGCGGDRDPAKRPLMGAAVARGADTAVVTSDNPRSEDPVGIILQVEDGMRGGEFDYVVEVDRRKAIRRALALAGPGDAVLIAGKGHEDYQIFADRTIHFDDREVAREELAAR